MEKFCPADLCGDDMALNEGRVENLQASSLTSMASDGDAVDLFAHTKMGRRTTLFVVRSNERNIDDQARGLNRNITLNTIQSCACESANEMSKRNVTT